jgi:hypothetical protein
LLGNEELRVAAAEAGWELTRAEQEFAAFTDYYRARDARRVWPLAWKSWCRRGRELEARDLQRSSRTGLRSTVTGIQELLEQNSERRTEQRCLKEKPFSGMSAPAQPGSP